MKQKMPMKNTLLLLLTAVIWGTSFVAQRMGMDYMRPFTFSAVRFFLGGMVLIPVVLLLRRLKSRGEKSARFGRNTWVGGVLCGLLIAVGTNLQQFGVVYTTVGKTGFITALYILFVPLLGLFLGKRAGPKLWGGVALAVVGLYLLCMTERLQLGRGDTMVFFCAIIYAVHILVIDRYIAEADGVMMACLQFFVAAILSALCMLLFEGLPSFETLWLGRGTLLYAGLLSCGVAYTLQIVGQKNANPTIASLILSLESVVAVLAAWVVLGQDMSPRELCGAGLMFLAILLAQLPDRKKKELIPKEKPKEQSL